MFYGIIGFMIKRYIQQSGKDFSRLVIIDCHFYWVAAYKLSTEQQASRNDNSKNFNLKQIRNLGLKEIRFKYGTLQKAKGTPRYAQHNRARLDLVAERKAQTKALETQLRDEYFDNVHTKSLSQQLDETLRNSEPKTHQEDSRKYTFSERARVANAFFPSKSVSDADILTGRLNIISDLVTLCAKQELPKRPSQLAERQTEFPRKQNSHRSSFIYAKTI